MTRVKVPLRRSKYKKKQSFSYIRKPRPKLKEPIKKFYGKVYNMREVRDKYGQLRGWKRA